MKTKFAIKKFKSRKNCYLDKETIRHLKKSEEDIENGRTKNAIEVFNELEEKYGF